MNCAGVATDACVSESLVVVDVLATVVCRPSVR